MKPLFRLALAARLLAVAALVALWQSAALAGAFTAGVQVTNIPPVGGVSGMFAINLGLNLAVDGDEWYLDDLKIVDPLNERGERLYFNPNRYLNMSDLRYETGSKNLALGAYWYDDLNSLSGHFTGGKIEVTCSLHEGGRFGYPLDTRTVVLDFALNPPAPVPSVPEPSAMVSAAIAALGGVALAAARRRRRVG